MSIHASIQLFLHKLSEANSVHSAESLLFLLYKDLQGVYIRVRTSSSSHLYIVLSPFRTSCCNQEIHYHTVEGLAPACRVKVDAQICSDLEAAFEHNVLTVSITQLVSKSSGPKKYRSVPEIVGRHETKVDAGHRCHCIPGSRLMSSS